MLFVFFDILFLIFSARWLCHCNNIEHLFTRYPAYENAIKSGRKFGGLGLDRIWDDIEFLTPLG
jgi:hypothetical protein